MGQPSAPLASDIQPIASASPSPSDPIHIVFSIDTMGVGGTEMNALRTAERLDRRRFRLTVVTLRGEGPLAERYANIGVPVRRFPIYSLYAPATIRQARNLARFFREERVSVVHCHDQYSNFFSVASARLARVPVIISSKRWLHSTRAYRIANGIGFRLSTRVLANSPAVAASLRESDRLAARRIVTVPNFVDDEAFTPPTRAQLDTWRRELGLTDGDQVVGIVASLLPIKDHGTLLRAAAKLRGTRPNVRVVIVGTGPELASLQSLANSLGVADLVRFAGLRPQTPSFHHLFDISVLCSTSEGFPNSLVEAMAAARPIVATNVGGVSDAVRHDDNGLLVPARAPDAFADAIESLLGDPERARRLGARGLSRARAEFSAPVVIGTVERLYDQLLTESRAR